MAARVTKFLRIFADVMTNERIIQIDSVDAYNKLYGWETLHPLVTVVNHANPMTSDLNHSRLNYGLYALFLKQGEGCSIRYGREKYDYQEGTVVSFKPGQVVEVEWDESRPMPPSRGLLFHHDLLYGTPPVHHTPQGEQRHPHRLPPAVARVLRERSS